MGWRLKYSQPDSKPVHFLPGISVMIAEVRPAKKTLFQYWAPESFWRMGETYINCPAGGMDHCQKVTDMHVSILHAYFFKKKTDFIELKVGQISSKTFLLRTMS